ncbi:MAG: TonB-dependent receptor [Tenacibaculum sp.]|nr:TonB-dependent receptor [Tenacibaculum sp.]
MNKLLVFVFCLLSSVIFSQNIIKGIVKNKEGENLKKVQVYNALGGLLTTSNSNGYFEIETNEKQIKLVFFTEEYHIKETKLQVNKPSVIVVLNPLTEELNEIEINQQRRKIFALRQLTKVEGTSIYEGKKSEVILIDELVVNKSTNNARQIYSQVVGLNIYENDDAGLQLNIGGRGLDPNRTSNFNTRQNGYDISADVLGYPESYYTPPTDALKEIQIIRGAASLQYGTQFGGLLNFKFKDPVKNKKFELVTRQSLGSYGLFNSFNSIGGTVDKTGYYGYVNYKKGDGFRPNSNFNSINIYAHLEHYFSSKTSLTLEATYLNYLAKQAGGLTDTQFNENPLQSNRKRNWFNVNWNLWAVKFKHNFSENSKFSLNLFGLNAFRKALGYRVSPIWLIDEVENGNYIYNRDLIVGNYKNWGLEARFLSNYNLGKQKHTYLLGLKYYNANNSERQGAGSKNTDADFSFKDNQYPTYSNKSSFKFPNQNLAFFGENIFNVSNKFSITPGFRLEYIKTESNGNYRIILRDGAGNPLPNGTFNYDDNRIKERSFALFGVGLSYKLNPSIEFYGNVSQNYRSVTFNDIRTMSPTFIVDENIDDEKGGTADIGIRGRWRKYLSYDISAFALAYNDRIGVYWVEEGPNSGDRLRTNIGDAFIYGLEGFIDVSISEILKFNNKRVALNYFVNTAITKSKYTKTKEKSVLGKEVEFIPRINLKTGVKFGYQNFLSSIQFTYLSKQYSDASHSSVDVYHRSFGTIGEIPAYSILDISFSYTYKKWKLETGVNNALNESYFTRRATGYPGPGIIPSAPRSWYVTLQYKL